jgi:hypothetical protein
MVLNKPRHRHLSLHSAGQAFSPWLHASVSLSHRIVPRYCQFFRNFRRLENWADLPFRAFLAVVISFAVRFFGIYKKRMSDELLFSLQFQYLSSIVLQTSLANRRFPAFASCSFYSADISSCELLLSPVSWSCPVWCPYQYPLPCRSPVDFQCLTRFHFCLTRLHFCQKRSRQIHNQTDQLVDGRLLVQLLHLNKCKKSKVMLNIW